jgi:hypothetical protein
MYCENYNLKLINFLEQGYSVKRLVSETSEFELLADYINEVLYDSQQFYNEVLLPVKMKSAGLEIENISTDYTTIAFTNDLIILTDLDGTLSQVSLPISDFQGILEEFFSFLFQLPLHGHIYKDSIE